VSANAGVLSADEYLFGCLRKNGTIIGQGQFAFQRGAAISPNSVGTMNVQANGTTDYFDVIVAHNHGSAIAFAVGGTTVTHFDGEFIGT
jgi:hypothetical protein